MLNVSGIQCQMHEIYVKGIREKHLINQVIISIESEIYIKGMLDLCQRHLRSCLVNQGIL